MKETKTAVTAPTRYRALVTLTVRNPETGRSTTYAKGKVVTADVWQAFGSATRQRFEPVVARTVKESPLEKKLHYRFMIADLDIIAEQAKMLPGEVAAWTVIREEQVRALELFRPKLNRSEVKRRTKFQELEAEWIDGALAIGRNVDFNWHTFNAALRAKFPADFNDNWDTGVGCNGTADFPVLDAEAAIAFREAIRPLVEAATREIFSSCA